MRHAGPDRLPYGLYCFAFEYFAFRCRKVENSERAAATAPPKARAFGGNDCELLYTSGARRSRASPVQVVPILRPVLRQPQPVRQQNARARFSFVQALLIPSFGAESTAKTLAFPQIDGIIRPWFSRPPPEYPSCFATPPPENQDQFPSPPPATCNCECADLLRASRLLPRQFILSFG